jgi:hypothetical protein
MRIIYIAVVLLLTGVVVAMAEDLRPESSEYQVTTVKGTVPVTKVEALRALVTDPNAVVMRCQQQELSDKATLRNRKKTRL